MSLAPVFKALSEESRLRLVRALSFGHFNVQELTQLLQTSQPTVSHHLRVLQSAGLVQSRKEGTWAYYTLANGDGDPLAAAVVHTFLDLAENSELGSHYISDDEAIQTILAARRETAREYFDAVAERWNRIRDSACKDASLIDALAARIPSAGALLELGCGSGALLERILPRKGETIGVDYSHAMLTEARKNLGEKAARVDLRLGYLERLPVSDHSVDIAAAFMVFHHVAEPREALRDVRRVLRDGGSFVAIDLTPHKDEQFRERFADLWLGFEPEKFSAWVAAAGFHSVETELLGADGEAFVISAVAGNN